MTDARADDPTLARSYASAAAFRASLTALSEPGRIVTAPSLAGGGGALSISPAAAMLLTLLCDGDARWRLTSDRADPETVRRLAFETGARPASDPADAAFWCGPWRALADEALPTAPIGAPDYPDRSATLIVEAESFEPAAGAAARLSGPGVAAPRRVALGGVGPDFWTWAAANAQRFPLGLDVFITAGERLMGLPRSTRISPLEPGQA